MKYPIEGSCQCGQVTYTLHKPPKMVQACHCTECQKLSTSPFSVTAIIETDAIEFRGELKEWSRIADAASLIPKPTATGRLVYSLIPATPVRTESRSRLPEPVTPFSDT